MSRRKNNTFVPRWGITTLRPEKKFTKVEQVEYINRMVKRANKAAGYVTTKQPATWNYAVNGQSGTVVAHTRSEARAEIKRAVGIKKKDRLPVGITLEKVVTDVGTTG